jgi:hypothetical protein
LNNSITGDPYPTGTLMLSDADAIGVTWLDAPIEGEFVGAVHPCTAITSDTDSEFV